MVKATALKGCIDRRPHSRWLVLSFSSKMAQSVSKGDPFSQVRANMTKNDEKFLIHLQSHYEHYEPDSKTMTSIEGQHILEEKECKKKE